MRFIVLCLVAGSIVAEAQDSKQKFTRQDHLRGAVLDVYIGEFEHPPLAALWSDPRVLITPHISGGGDPKGHRAIDLFCENLAAYIAGQPLKNVIDWERGY